MLRAKAINLGRLQERGESKRRKYGNRKTEVDGLVFDSKAEAERWGELVILQRAGRIAGLQRQVSFELLPRQVLPSGKVELPVHYVADFQYRRSEGLVVEDVKGKPTPEYILKRKLMAHVYGIEVHEVHMRGKR